MIWTLIGILLGIILGMTSNFTIPVGYIKYTAVLIIAILDSLFGAIKADLSKEDYNSTIFTIGLIFNASLALLITLTGEKLGLDLYLAVTVVFTLRIFANLGKIRSETIDKMVFKRNKDKE